MDPKIYKLGDQIIKPGNPIENLFIIRHGQFCMEAIIPYSQKMLGSSQVQPKKRKGKMFIFTDGDIVGLDSLPFKDDHRASYSVTCSSLSA